MREANIAKDVRETQHIKAFPHRKTPSCTADTDCLTTWCLFGVSTFKTVNYGRPRYTFSGATKARSTALFRTSSYGMVVINYCSRRKTSGHSTEKANCSSRSCPALRRKNPAAFPKTVHGVSVSVWLMAGFPFPLITSSATTGANTESSSLTKNRQRQSG